jgi:hypothetical protein
LDIVTGQKRQELLLIFHRQVDGVSPRRQALKIMERLRLAICSRRRNAHRRRNEQKGHGSGPENDAHLNIPPGAVFACANTARGLGILV